MSKCSYKHHTTRNASNPAVAWSGPNNTGVSQNTVRKGATLVQVYSGLIYRGIGLLQEIKADLTAALKRGHRDSLESMVGVDAAEMTAESWPS